MGILETMIDIPAEHEKNVFGQFDIFAKKIERALHVTLIARNGKVKVLGEEKNVERAQQVLSQLTELSRRGNTIQEQNVDYALSLTMEDSAEDILTIDKDLICHTLQGKPIKPKTLGQKKYVDAIREKMITFGLGPAGTGKTMGAKAIAAGLGLPYMKYTCSAGSEIYDFVGQVLPSFDEATTGNAVLDAEREQLKQMGGINYANVAKLMNLPGLDDMDYDPTGVYMALTGAEKSDATSQDCMSVVLDMVTDKVRALTKVTDTASNGGQSFTYEETDFIKALKNGYLVEIQEPTVIMQPGVLVGLNSLLEQEGSITLPTGEVIDRHPDTVIVITTNIDYEGCRGMNQSTVDRMSLVMDIELPSPEVMVQRAMAVTGATDEYQVSQMFQIVNDMADFCRKNSITDGNVGMRSLLDWIVSTEVTGDVYSSALSTVISKATSNEEDRQALIASVLEPIFAPKSRRKKE
mgnify:CR=1 FL=1